jgi:16S rRNA G966 N2-methylase RsmD
MVAIEHMSGLEFPDTIGSLEKTKSKKFGKSTMTYYIPKED